LRQLDPIAGLRYAGHDDGRLMQIGPVLVCNLQARPVCKWADGEVPLSIGRPTLLNLQLLEVVC